MARVGRRDLLVTPSGSVIDPGSGAVLVADVGQLWHASPVAAGAMVYFIGCTSKAEPHRQEGCTAMAVALTEAAPGVTASTASAPGSGRRAFYLRQRTTLGLVPHVRPPDWNLTCHTPWIVPVGSWNDVLVA